MKRLTVAVFLIFLLGFVGWADALPFFYASTTSGPTQQGSTPAVTSGQYSTGQFDLQGSASALPGSVGITAQTNFSGEGDFSGAVTLSHFSDARMILDDIVISGPGDEVMVSLNLTMSGSLQALAEAQTADTYSTALSGASANFVGSLGPTSTFFLPAVGWDGSVNVQNRDGNEFPDITQVTATGLFGSFTNNTSTGFSLAGNGFTTPSFLAEVGAPLTLDLHLYGGAYAGFDNRFAGNRVVNASGTTQFGNTISFPIVGPVFNLPEGYTINSLSGLIVDNRHILSPPAQVPEPSSLLLLAYGLAGMVALRRKFMA